MNSAGQSSPFDFNRMIGGMIRAAQLDKGFYAMVEKDTSYSTEAWGVVILVSVISALGAFLGRLLLGDHSLFGAIGSLIWQLIAGVGGFALWAWLVQWVGTQFFKGQGDFGEVQRTLGFAYAPQVLGVFGFIPCVGWLAAFVGWIWSLVCGYIAIREAMDQDNANAILTIVVAGVIVFLLTTIIGSILGLGAVAGAALTGRL